MNLIEEGKRPKGKPRIKWTDSNGVAEQQMWCRKSNVCEVVYEPGEVEEHVI